MGNGKVWWLTGRLLSGPVVAEDTLVLQRMGAEAASAPSTTCGYFILNQALSMPP
jgi:hypothetical protein